MRKKVALSTACLAFLIGCGSGSSISDADINYEPINIGAAVNSKVEYKDYTVKVVDDNIIGAKVSAFECNDSKELEDSPGTYVLLNCVSKPKYIVAEGGKIGESNVTQSFPLTVDTSLIDGDQFVINPITTMLVNTTPEEAEEILNSLGLNKEDVLNPKEEYSEDTIKAFQKINSIYIAAVEKGAVTNKVKFVQTLKDIIKEENTSINDLNISDIAQKVAKKSQEQPELFGLVFIDKDDFQSENILEELNKIQNPTTVNFLGLVFDEKIEEANISIYENDNDTPIYTTVSDEDGKWKWEVNESYINKIKTQDFILIFEAKKDNFVLRSSVSSATIRELLGEKKNLTPSSAPDLVISNVTTAENAVLEKKDAFKDVQTFTEKRSEVKTYYNDKILTTAAVIKAVIDENKTQILKNVDVNNTYDLAKNLVTIDEDTNKIDVNVTRAIKDVDVNVTQLEQNITTNALLNTQLKAAPVEITHKDEFENAAKEANNVFYRLLAYYLPGEDGILGTEDDIFRREYQKIITLAGHYEVDTYHIDGNDTKEWIFDNKEMIENANFTNGKFAATNNDYVITYSLEGTENINVSALCKTYTLYEVSKNIVVGNDINSSTPLILVDSFDVVDMFRRMPTEDEESFEDLKEIVKGKDKSEVNFELNRYIREQIDDIKDYFSDKNSTNECNF